MKKDWDIHLEESDYKAFSLKLQTSKNEDANNSTKSNQGQGRGQNQCYHCKRYGNFECDFRLKEGNNNKSVNYVEEDDEASPINLFLPYDKAENGSKDIVYLDSGCSIHMSGNNEFFSTMGESFKSSIKLGDDKTLEVASKGAMEVHTKESMKSVKDIY